VCPLLARANREEIYDAQREKPESKSMNKENDLRTLKD